MIGTLIQALVSGGLWPLPEPKQFTEPVWALQGKLESLSTKRYCALMNHEECRPFTDYKAYCTKVLNGIDSSPTKNQLRHLQAQAKKLGINA